MFQKAFQNLGAQFAVSDALVANMERFSGNSINEVRYSLFCMKALSEVSLPPCRNALVQHIKRANYQAAVWRKALQPNINAPSPNGNDWVVDANNEVLARWMTRPKSKPHLRCCKIILVTAKKQMFQQSVLLR